MDGFICCSADSVAHIHASHDGGRSIQDIARGRDGVTVAITGLDREVEDMDIDIDIEGRRVDAETRREQHELARQDAERARAVAEKSRASAEEARRTVAAEVSATVETLTTLVSRMEAVEALRREATKDKK